MLKEAEQKPGADTDQVVPGTVNLIVILYVRRMSFNLILAVKA
jgi:hypothetical protein